MIILAQAFPDVFGPALQPVCAALLACIALALPFVWMGERGVCPFAAFRALLRLQTWAGRIVLCLLFACGAYVCGSKPASPSARVGSAPVCAPAARSADAPALRTYDVLDPAVAGIFGAWTNAVTNACFTGVCPGPAADLLRVAWPGLADRPAQAMPFLEFYACRDLASGAWAPVGEVPVTSTAAGMVVEVPHALLPEGAGRAFHVFGFAADSDFDGVSDLRERLVSGTDPLDPDTDGDGVSDGWELAYGYDPLDPRSRVIPPVHPFDLDGDGLENSVDPTPANADADAHATNAEWYNVVCSNVFSAVDTPGGVLLALRAPDVNVDAYFFVEAPENPACENRHVLGVGEKVRFTAQPALQEMTYRAVKGDWNDRTTAYDTFGGSSEVTADAPREYTCPISANYHPDITVSLLGVQYVPALTLVEPSEVVTEEARCDGVCLPSGDVGGCVLWTTNRIGPMHVSFQGIAVSELPCSVDDVIPP